MGKKTTYYLWKEKESTNNQVKCYITDYKEIRQDGKVKIENYGYLDVELVHSSENKNECFIEAQKLMSNG